ncbi:alpha/beta hydrolase [Maribacter sp. 2307ULW6-5]|uniref:alpha/beta hydrolase n=1 Tax=Maribacter sp. 2307ULW6-5 TaxID=3386275 RepID=UPI0039BD4515
MKYIVPLCLFILGSWLNAQDLVVPLYDGAIPNAIPNTIEEEIQMEDTVVRRIFKVKHPTISIYKAKNTSNRSSAILICPGGGYTYLSFTPEGVDLAKWLQNLGITGIVLKSRLPNDKMMTKKENVPLQDAQRAMELIRENAEDWNIDTKKVGVMGFSAGGHLAASLSTHHNEKQRPDFSVLIYPVITMDSTFTHMGSRKKLLGPNPTDELVAEYSNEDHVDEQTPPAFLVHSADDTAVPFANSVRFYENLIENGVKDSELHVFQNGGHGYGMALRKEGNVAQWTQLLKNWLITNNWTKE